MKKKKYLIPFTLCVSVCAILVGAISASAEQVEMDRTVLPIAEPMPPEYTELDVRNATPPPRFEVKAPKDAPSTG